LPDLVSLADVQTFLGISGDDALLTDLLEHLEALFESETGRTGKPFQAAASDRAEVHDGTGSADLFLEYPISNIDSVKLGYDSSDPDETLDPTDVDELTYAAGHRKISRTDGGTFGLAGSPRFVHVQYDTQADLPEDAQLAIKRAVAQVYRQRGSEDSTFEMFGQGQYQRRLSNIVADDPLWQRAVAAHRRMVLA
jgi:hypothetical protein